MYDCFNEIEAGYGVANQALVNGRLSRLSWVVVNKYAPEARPTRKIYLSRRFQSARKMKDEDALESLLQKMGFEVVVSEKLSIAEQVSLAASASILAGATGSSMYLAGFQAAGTKTIIFAPSNFLLFDDFCFASIGRRKIYFAFGSETSKVESDNSRASEWTLGLDSHLEQSLSEFMQSHA